MYLTKEEEGTLRGEEGIAKAKALRVLVKVGEALGAERLVDVSWVHISGVSYKNIGEPGLRFIEELHGEGGRFSVKTTLNPVAMDLSLWREMGVPEGFALRQLRLVKLLREMGAHPTFSCIPYLWRRLREGEHVAWGESNAVLYANSVAGALTNREASVLTLMEALTGKAPLVGLRVKENRRPTIVVGFDEAVVERARAGIYPYSLLGYCLGGIVIKGVPYLRGFRVPEGELKNFLAGVGASSSIGLVIIEGVSPDSRRVKGGDLNGLERVTIGVEEVEEAKDSLTEPGRFDAMALGCPHLSLEEVKEVYEALKGRDVKKRLILYTSKFVSDKFKEMGKLRALGIEVYSDTCMVVSPLGSMGINSVALDSAKAAYYLSSQGVKTYLLPRSELLRMVSDESY